MPLQTLDTSILPSDALSFYDDNFYNLVENIAGTAEAKLIEIQGIRSVYSFLNTEDVFEILTISCSALNIIKKSVCFEADDKSFIIKPGCRSNIRYLYQFLHQKHEEHLKEISGKPKHKKQSTSQQNGNSVIDNTQDSIQSRSTSSQQNDTTPSDTLTAIKRHDLIIHILNEWIKNNGVLYGIPNEKLIENKDFRLLIDGNESDIPTSITCSCGINIILENTPGNISLSNYYKHLKSKKCIIKKKISKHVNGESNETVEEESSDAEESQNDTTSEDIQYVASASSIDKPATLSKSYKRTTDQDNNSFSKRKRI